MKPPKAQSIATDCILEVIFVKRKDVPRHKTIIKSDKASGSVVETYHVSFSDTKLVQKSVSNRLSIGRDIKQPVSETKNSQID